MTRNQPGDLRNTNDSDNGDDDDGSISKMQTHPKNNTKYNYKLLRPHPTVPLGELVGN